MKRFFPVLMGCIFLLMLSAGYIFAQPRGKAIVDNACSKCHNTKRIYSADKKAADWEATLDRMIKKGAKVTPENRDEALKHLNTLNK
jgi:hypothetical protein